MASRVPSVGAGMLPLSQRRPRTPAAAGAAEWESNFPSHSSSFPQATGDFGLKSHCPIIKTPPFSSKWPKTVWEVDFILFMPKIVTFMFCNVLTLMILCVKMCIAQKSGHNECDRQINQVWDKTSSTTFITYKKSLSESSNKTDRFVPARETFWSKRIEDKRREEEERRAVPPNSVLTMAVNGCAPRSLGQSKHTAPFLTGTSSS